MEDSKTDTLTFQEISHLNDRKVELKAEHTTYIEAHPELRTLLNDFVCAALLEKPPDAFAFAADHFAAIAPAGMAPPALTRGPPPLVLVGFKGTPLVDLLRETFVDAFDAPIATTTRRPEAGEEPGVRLNFTTREQFVEDIEAGKFFEHEEDENGFFFGTTLDAIARVKSFGKVPLLLASAARAASARACAAISPAARNILGVTSVELTSDEGLAAQAAAFEKVVMCDEFDSAFQELVGFVAKAYPSLKQS